MQDELALIDRARVALAKARDVCEAAEIRRQAIAVAEYMKRRDGAEDAAAHANEIRLRAERRIGELLREKVRPGGSPEALSSGATKLPPEVTRDQSSKWQKIAQLPEDVFEEEVSKPDATTTSVVARAQVEQRKEKRAQRYEDAGIGESGELEGEFRVVYADPPWTYTRTGLTEYGHADTHYPCMSESELCALRVKEHTLPDSVLWLWTTTVMLPQALRVAAAWGFNYKAQFIWDKGAHNFGHYNSVRHEILLICTRGSCTPDVKKLHPSVQSIPRGEHSEKPAHFREIIDHIYPNGPRIELFARKKAPGWTAWGNQ